MTVTASFDRQAPSLQQADNELSLTWGERMALVQCLVLSFGMGLLVLTVPVFMLQLYDRILPSQNIDTLLVLSGLAVVLLGLYGLLDSMRGRILLRIGSGLELRALNSLTLLTPDRLDLDRLRLATQSSGPAALFDLPALPIFLLFLFVLHPWLAGVAVVAMLILALVSGFGARRSLLMPASGDALDRVLDGTERLWTSPLQMVAAHRMAERRVDQRLKDLGELDRRSRVGALLKTLRLVAQIGCLAMGGYLAMHGNLSAAAIVAATILMSRVLAPIELLAQSWPVLLEGWRAWRRLRHMSAAEDATPCVPVDDKPELSVESGVIAPPGIERPVLRGIELRLQTGAWLGIAGASGTGKSALIRTIAGIWPPRFGRVQIGGHNPHNLPAAIHRQTFGIVHQRARLVAGTIAENIAGFRPAPDARKIVAAARKAGIHGGLAQGARRLWTPGRAGRRSDHVVAAFWHRLSRCAI